MTEADRYHAAVGLLAAMAMDHTDGRYVLFYDWDAEEFFVHRLWYDAAMRLLEEEVARDPVAYRAVEAAYEACAKEKQRD